MFESDSKHQKNMRLFDQMQEESIENLKRNSHIVILEYRYPLPEGMTASYYGNPYRVLVIDFPFIVAECVCTGKTSAIDIREFRIKKVSMRYVREFLP